MSGARTGAADFRALGCRGRLVVTDAGRLEDCRRLLARELAAVDAACSRFRADSELAGLNSANGRLSAVGPLLAEALAMALRAAEMTDGDVDPTVGSAMRTLGYDRDFALVERDGRPVRLTVRPVPGWRRVRLDRAAGTVMMPPGTTLDLGATAKAWAADRTAQMLAKAAGCGVLVSLGGDTAVAGPAPSGGWRIRVQDVTGHPDEPPVGPHTTVAIRHGGLATSGTAARHWRRGDRELHHVVDPRTGLPAVTPWRTVTVAAASCADANTATTAALVRDETAYAWLNSIGLAARLVAVDGTVKTTASWPAERNTEAAA
ncbi:FAD:protein FMN transferase [Streptomyces sp. NPDC002730]|uniref:FAD:protein FMN transferase n=1 Tax=Streptomyces sp. NPDC002730 TaxID=3364662 RepID=UPI0036C4CD0A